MRKSWKLIQRRVLIFFSGINTSDLFLKEETFAKILIIHVHKNYTQTKGKEKSFVKKFKNI